MTEAKIRDLFMAGIDCSQVVTGEFAEALGMEKESLQKLSACFGGGMQCGETCGAVTGALMVIGSRYGHSENGNDKQKGIMAAKAAQFKAMFAEKYPSYLCRELLGHDISKEGEMDKVLKKGLLFDFCPEVVKDTIDILEKIL